MPSTSRKPKSYQNLQSTIRSWKTPAIETFANEYPDREYLVVMTFPEFTCVCPKTGLPDFAVLTLSYTPDKHCLELKSLKEYLLAFRDKGIFHENVVNRVLDDLVATAKPRYAKLEGVFNSRGGIQTTVTREFSRTSKNQNGISTR